METENDAASFTFVSVELKVTGAMICALLVLMSKIVASLVGSFSKDTCIFMGALELCNTKPLETLNDPVMGPLLVLKLPDMADIASIEMGALLDCSDTLLNRV